VAPVANEGKIMNRRNRGILYGMVLGDGNLYLQTPNSCILTIGHSPKQKEYLEFKAHLLSSICGGKAPWVGSYKSKNKQTGKTYENYQLKKTFSYFRQMHRVLYPKGKKIYTEKALSYVTDYGLALWYCDDGSGYHKKNKAGSITSVMTRISTYCTLEEAEILKKWFKDRYDIDVKFDTDKRNGLISLRFNTTDSKKFVSIIAPYVPQCMKYKIEHVDKYIPKSAKHPNFTIETGEDIV
jgi:recombination protein RecA